MIATYTEQKAILLKMAQGFIPAAPGLGMAVESGNRTKMVHLLALSNFYEDSIGSYQLAVFLFYRPEGTGHPGYRTFKTVC